MHGLQNVKFVSDFSRTGNVNVSCTNNIKISDTKEKSPTLESLGNDLTLQTDGIHVVRRCWNQNDV